MKVFEYKDNRSNYVPEEDTLKKLINNRMNPVEIHYIKHFDNPSMDKIAPKYRPKLLVQISPIYGFEMGFCKGKVNNYKIIVFLCKHILGTHRGIRIRYASFTDKIVITNLRKIFQNGKDRQLQGLISKDLLYIYRYTGPKGYKIYWRLPKDEHLIYSTLERMTLDYRLMMNIMHLSFKYHRKDCTDLWFEWIYLAMIAEYFPKFNSKEHKMYATSTGKYVKALGLYQCLYDTKYHWNSAELSPHYMKASAIAKFSYNKHHIKHFAIRYLDPLSKKDIRRWISDINYRFT